MTFIFDNTLSTDLALVRFNIGDTSEEGAYLEDETITALLASEGSVGAAVIKSIRYILTQLAIPNFKEDWLSVDYAKARESFEKLLKDKADEFDITLSKGISITSSVSNPSRADSHQEDNVYDGSP
ncbi:MAG: hypothetical protein JRE23_16505 [Deltaproteobacteria bacterium]|nr:hypothetical protein [Deltaproteobacteria bacterium]